MSSPTLLSGLEGCVKRIMGELPTFVQDLAEFSKFSDNKDG